MTKKNPSFKFGEVEKILYLCKRLKTQNKYEYPANEIGKRF